jgi:hypothetical protein
MRVSEIAETALSLLTNDNRCLSAVFMEHAVMTDISHPAVGVEERCPPEIEADVVELQLLLPGWQASKLETVAHQRGMTAAEMVRHLLRSFLTVVPSQCNSPSI